MDQDLLWAYRQALFVASMLHNENRRPGICEVEGKRDEWRGLLIEAHDWLSEHFDQDEKLTRLRGDERPELNGVSPDAVIFQVERVECWEVGTEQYVAIDGEPFDVVWDDRRCCLILTL